MPYLFNNGFTKLVIDNSNKKNNNLNQIMKILKDEKIFDNVLVLRHHSNIEATNSSKKKISANNYSMKNFINSPSKINYFEKQFKEFGKVYMIYGNSRNTKCYKHKNITHIWSGIGLKNTDTVLLISNGVLYRYKIGI